MLEEGRRSWEERQSAFVGEIWEREGLAPKDHSSQRYKKAW